MRYRIFGFSDLEAAALIQSGKEYILDVLYDCCQLTTGTSTTLFLNQIGSSGNGITNKTRLHTNMETSGKLPNNEEFRVVGFGQWILPILDTNYGVKDADAAANVTFLGRLTEGYWKAKFMNKDYRWLPLSFLTSFRCKTAHGVASRTIYTIENPLAKQEGFFRLLAPVHIGAGQQFSVDVAVTTAPGASCPYYLYFGLWGVRIRSIQ